MEQGKRLLPPYQIINDFLADDLVDERLEHAARHKEEFQAAGIHDGYDPSLRVSQSCISTPRSSRKFRTRSTR